MITIPFRHRPALVSWATLGDIEHVLGAPILDRDNGGLKAPAFLIEERAGIADDAGELLGPWLGVELGPGGRAVHGQWIGRDRRGGGLAVVPPPVHRS